MQDDDMKDLQSSNLVACYINVLLLLIIVLYVFSVIQSGNLAMKHAYAWLPSNSNLRGVCMSSSGFGIMVALFLVLLLLSATMTALMVRRHMNDHRSKM